MMADGKKTNADAGTKATDSVLDELEKKIKTVYKRAYNELLESIIEFNNNYKVKSQKRIQQLQEGKITQEEYNAWEAGQAFQSKMWAEKKAHLLNVVNNANQKAVDLVNGQTKNVFATNANYIGYELEQDVGASISFSLYDSNTIARLIKENPQLLPQKKLDGEKDKAWNNKKVVSAIQQGILQGRTIPQIAQSLSSSLAESNMKAMIRTARTAMTSAENAGRLEGMKQAEEDGVMLKKQWLAANDARVRDTHAELNGQIAEVSKPFKSSLGDIMYPGDPTAHPGNVYNCRCTLKYVYPQFSKAGAKDYYYDKDGNMQKVTDTTFQEWIALKEQQALEQKASASGVTHEKAHVSDDLVTKKAQSEHIFSFHEQLLHTDIPKSEIDKFFDDVKKEIGYSDLGLAYKNGQMSAALAKKFEQYAKKTLEKADDPSEHFDAWKTVSGMKTISEIKDMISSVDKKLAAEFQKELKSIADSQGKKPKDIFEAYKKDLLQKGQFEKLDSIIVQSLEKAGMEKPSAEKTTKQSFKTQTAAKKASSNHKSQETASGHSKIVKEYGQSTFYDLETLFGGNTDEIEEITVALGGWQSVAKKWNNYLDGTLPASTLNKVDSILLKKMKEDEEAEKQRKSIQVKPSAELPKATTKEWIQNCKANPSIKDMLKIEKANFKKYTKKEEESLELYTGSSYEEMNAYLRLKAAKNKNYKKYEDYAEDIKRCHSALEKSALDRDMVLRRGTDLGDIAGLFMRGDFDGNVRTLQGMSVADLNKKFQGAVGVYAGFTSTSSQWDKGFKGPVEILINAPKGAKAASIMGISEYGTSEGETLLIDGTTVVCEKIEEITKDTKSAVNGASGIRVFLTIIP